MWILALSTAFAATCDTDSLDKGVEALKIIDDDQVVTIAAAAVREGCTLDEGLASVLDGVAGGFPAVRPTLDAKSVTVATTAWLAACPGGLEAAAAAARGGRVTQRTSLWTACALADNAWFTEDEWTTSRGLVFLPLIVPEVLRQAGASPDVVRVYARGLIGLPNRTPPVIVREFVPLVP